MLDFKTYAELLSLQFIRRTIPESVAWSYWMRAVPLFDAVDAIANGE